MTGRKGKKEKRKQPRKRLPNFYKKRKEKKKNKKPATHDVC